MSDNPNCIEFAYAQLQKATEHFDETCKLGEGGFGPVYKGTLLHTTVAIKRLRKENGNLNTSMAHQQFRTEVTILTKFRHPNLLTLMGYCVHQDNFCLVYEFMSNGTLEDALANSVKKDPELPWEIRMGIACDTARALLYLHTADAKSPLVHRDVKSANVLLDVAYRAKLGDFGLARSLEGAGTKTRHIVGTSGYIPPEYYRGHVSIRMDSFGFGVILLEIMTGMASYDSERYPNDLITYMEPYITEKKAGTMHHILTQVDPTSGRWPASSIDGLCKIARKCLEPKHNDRAKIEEIYPELQKNLHNASLSALKLEKHKEHIEKRKGH